MDITEERYRELELKVIEMRAQILLLSDELKRLKALVPENCRNPSTQVVD